MILDLAGQILYYAALGSVVYVVSVGLLAASVAVVQEYKIWAPSSLPSLSLVGASKVFIYNVFWVLICVVGCSFISIKWLLMLGTSDLEAESNLWVEKCAAVFCTRCFVGKVQVIGAEHLPESNDKTVPAPVFIANHASQIDVSLPYYLGQQRRFKWIAKRSIFYIPGVGQCTWLGGHVVIDRRTGKNKGSVSNLYDKSNEAIQSGIPMFLFPQGTRRIAEKLPFKKGAFVIAQTNKSPIIPISIDIPKNAWNELYPLNLLWGAKGPVVKVTVHKPVPATDDLEDMKQRCMDQIYSVLPPVGGSELSKKKE